MKKVIKFLQFLRLVDDNEQVSLTNIAVMVAVYKISEVKAVSFEDLGLLLIPLLGYAYKKHLNK